MNPQEPQESGPSTKDPATRHHRSLRDIPGFTFAAVAFVLVVVLGVGGTAIANWNQSTTATIAITAGAAPTPTPTPTPKPTVPPTRPPTTPVVVQGTVVANPRIRPRPALIPESSVKCTSASLNSGKYTMSWPSDPSSGVSYVVSLSISDKKYGTPLTQTVTESRAYFTLADTPAAYGNYMVRIQAMKDGVAGDPVNSMLVHQENSQRCDRVDPDGWSPLGAFSVNARPANNNEGNNVLNLSWTALSPGTNYVVTLVKSDGTASFGTEFNTTALGATLSFPPRRDQSGNAIAGAPFYGEYLLRIIPINGAQIGDPVYKKVLYGAYTFENWDFKFQN